MSMMCVYVKCIKIRWQHHSTRGYTRTQARDMTRLAGFYRASAENL